jgi:hypothetical protein
MIKMCRQKRASKFMNLLGATLAASVAWATAAKATDCPRKGTLGTSRVLEVDAAATPRVGLKNFPRTLPLGDHEVVLTFDDGPWPPTTPRRSQAVNAMFIVAPVAFCANGNADGVL